MRRSWAHRFPAAAAAGVILLLTAPAAGAQQGTPAQSAPGAHVAVLDVAAAAGQKSDGIELLALQRILRTLGIPCDVLTTRVPLDAYRAVFTAGALLNAVSAAGIANDLYDYVEGGGVLVSAGEAGSDTFSLFGVATRVASRTRFRMSLSGSDPALAYLTSPLLRTISLGNGEPPFYKEVIWSYGANLAAGSTALGLFEDRSAGFSVHPYGRGRAYLLGVSYTDSVLLPQVGGSYNAERQYVNGIEPSADSIMLLLKSVWESSDTPAVSLATIPWALPGALILTHDVDAQTSFVDSLKFAALEKRYGVTSTFFINTKYFKDENDIAYFNVPENQAAVRELRKAGWDIGSHTVAHSATLASAPEGDPSVSRATYDPVKRLTVWGELRVSKELLDALVPGQSTIAYRSGDLAFPRSLIRILQAAGYLYDSTYSANATLSAFAFTALEDQVIGARESRVVEIPVTLDDSQGFLTAKTVAATVEKWSEVLRANAQYGGVTVLLMHPSDTRTQTYKLDAQEGLMKQAVAMGAWMGDLTSFGRFWASRAVTGFSTSRAADGALVIRVNARGGDLDPSLGFEVARYAGKVVVTDSDGNQLDYRADVRNGKMYVSRPRPAR